MKMLSGSKTLLPLSERSYSRKRRLKVRALLIPRKIYSR